MGFYGLRQYQNAPSGANQRVSGRFNLRLGREEKLERTCREEQRRWLTAIRDHLRVYVEMKSTDLMDAPESSRALVALSGRALFGVRLPGLLDELTDAAIA